MRINYEAMSAASLRREAQEHDDPRSAEALFAMARRAEEDRVLKTQSQDNRTQRFKQRGQCR